MLRSEWSPSRVKSTAGRTALAAAGLWAVFLLAAAPLARAQQGTSEFTLSAQSFTPAAVAPSGVASSQMMVGFPAGSYTGFTLNLSCQVTSQQTATSAPAC